MTTHIDSHAETNRDIGSIVTVKVAPIICKLSIEKNEFDDFLPVIRTSARTFNHKILYEISIRATLLAQTDGQPVSGHKVAFISNRANDQFEITGHTNRAGEISFKFRSRDAGKVTLTTLTAGINLTPFSFDLTEAWYESPFLITGYNVCDENDFSGTLTDASGLDEQCKDDFLYGARGVPMQGTGKTTTGRFIRLASMKSVWERNAKGSPTTIKDKTKVSFAYTDGFYEKFGVVKEDKSIAVDPKIIPRRAKVNIDGVGNRTADDTGSAIKIYHIDNFLGSGAAVVKVWLKGNVNGTKRRVKFLGYS